MSVVLELTTDPASEPSPAWTNITTYLRGISWGAGVDQDDDEPRAGHATFTLKNTNRRFEPDFAAGAYYPAITIGCRFRLTVDGTPMGIFHAQTFELTYPAGTSYSEVIVTCTDGHGSLAWDNLPELDPPDATSYAEVVMFDEPLSYHRLGDPPTATEAAAEAGNAGVYKSRTLLTIGTAGGILGDPDTAVTFATSGSAEGHVEIPLDALETTLDGDHLTVEAWINTTATDVVIVSGPASTTGPMVWSLSIGGVGAIGSDTLAFNLETAAATVQAIQDTTNANDGAWHHVVGTWEQGQARLYLDGELVGTATGTPPLLGAAASPKIRIGSALPADNVGYTGAADEVAIYETTLAAGRVLAHYQAGAERGYPEQTAGERIAAVLDSAHWSEAGIQTAGLTVQPLHQHGQSKLEVVNQSARAEQPGTLLWWDRDGNPQYRGFDWQGTGTYNTVQATFGDGPGEVPFMSLVFEYDDDLENDVTVAREGGVAQTVTDQDSIDAHGRRRGGETGLILAHDEDARTIAAARLDRYSEPEMRVRSITLTGSNPAARAQILARDLGDMIRVKRTGGDGARIDRITNIIRKEFTATVDGHIVATFTTARGFNASVNVWRLGVAGFSELGSTTVLG